MRRRRVRGGLRPSRFVVLCLTGCFASLGGCASDHTGAGAPTASLAFTLRTLASAAALPLRSARDREEALIAQAIAEHEMRNP